MSMRYEDDKSWKKHYDDWMKLKEELKHFPQDVTKQQHEYRMKIIYRLIQEYEAMNKND